MDSPGPSGPQMNTSGPTDDNWRSFTSSNYVNLGVVSTTNAPVTQALGQPAHQMSQSLYQSASDVSGQISDGQGRSNSVPADQLFFQDQDFQF